MAPGQSRRKISKAKKMEEVLAEKPTVVSQFYQTKLCKHFQNGSCLYGDNCSFSHSESYLRERPNLSKTKLCPLIEQGDSCEFGSSSCPYAHTLEELRATPMLFRTVVCAWWKKGQCEFGDSCRFAHGDEQLRPSCEIGQSSSLSPLQMSSPSSKRPLASGYSHAFNHPQYLFVLNSIMDVINKNPSCAVLAETERMGTAEIAAMAALNAVNDWPSMGESSLCLPTVGGHPAMSSPTGLHQSPQTSSPLVQPPPAVPGETISWNSLRKGFASSPALLNFFCGNEEIGSENGTAAERPRADSLPTDNFLQELERLWIDTAAVGGTSTLEVATGVPLMRTDPFLSASHMTLDGYQIND